MLTNSIILFLYLFNVGLSYLTNTQLIHISKILSYNDKKLNNLQYSTRIILFNHSKPFVHGQLYKFYDNSKFSQKMSIQSKQNLLYYGYYGLWKAVLNFNGKSNFYNYASIYIDSEFKKGLTHTLSSSILPHRFRVNKKYYNEHKDEFKKHFVTSFSNIDKEYHKHVISNFNNSCNQYLNDLYFIVDNLPIKDRLYFRYRYDIFTCRIQRSYKDVGILMCVSEETARKNIIRITKDVINKLNTI